MSDQINRPEWNATAYHRVSNPHVAWGRKVLARIPLRGDEIVLDAGCGTGRLTRELLEKLPQGRVVALDVSDNMLAAAKAYLLPRFGDRVQFVPADLLRLPVDGLFHGGFDGVFSTATFHWVLDHDALFRGLFGVLRPGGWLRAQCGGGPNLARLMAHVMTVASQPPFVQHLGTPDRPVYYSSAEEAADRLRAAGFGEVETGLEAAPTAFEDLATYAEFVRTVILRHHMEALPMQGLRERFIAELAELAAQDVPAFELDYWRLNLKATKLTQ